IEDTDLWTAGDPIILSEPEYWIHGTVDIFQSIHVEGADANNPPLLHFYDNGFRAKEDTISITLKNLILDGYDPNDGKTANHALRFDQANWYNEYEITLENVEVYDFNGGIQLYKNQKKHVKSLTIDNCYFHDLYGDYVLDPRLNWVENTTITNSTFANVKGFIKNYYNNNEGANDDKFGTQTSTVLVDHNTFYNAASDAFIQQNDGKDGSLDFTFSNNIVSGLLDYSNSRPFRIDPLVGDVTLSNNVFHDIDSDRDTPAYNYETAAAQANVTATANTTDDPMFVAAPLNFNFGDAALLVAGSDAGQIGDPEWILSLESVVTILPVTDDITEGDVVQLEAATNQTITWSVKSDGGEAMIDEMTGELVALEKGQVTVTATSNENSNVSDQVTLDIQERIIPVESIELFATPGTINSAGTARIIAKILPVDATDRKVMWSSSDETIGSFGDEFVSVIEFNATLAGTVRLYGSAMGAEGLIDSVDLVVEQAVTSVEVTAAADIVNAGDYTLQFTATVGPEDAVDPAVSWSVNVPDTVATIDETGLLTAIDTASSVVVTATSVDGSEISGSYEVAIVRPVGSITVAASGGATSMNAGETLQMSAVVGPDDAYNKDYTWAVSSTTVATIDENGLLTGKKGGVVAVSAIATDGSETRGTLNIEVIQTLGLNPVNDLATIYPNPSSDFINVTVDGAARIQIITLTGQKVITRELAGEEKIEIRTLPAGVYVLKVSTGTEVQTINFVKY
ncbi:MAG: Ig-like domain-containing protein, partial [Cyclobacteriaceae bacterium]